MIQLARPRMTSTVAAAMKKAGTTPMVKENQANTESPVRMAKIQKAINLDTSLPECHYTRRP